MCSTTVWWPCTNGHVTNKPCQLSSASQTSLKGKKRSGCFPSPSPCQLGIPVKSTLAVSSIQQAFKVLALKFLHTKTLSCCFLGSTDLPILALARRSKPSKWREAHLGTAPIIGLGPICSDFLSPSLGYVWKDQMFKNTYWSEYCLTTSYSPLILKACDIFGNPKCLSAKLLTLSAYWHVDFRLSKPNLFPDPLRVICNYFHTWVFFYLSTALFI